MKWINLIGLPIAWIFLVGASKAHKNNPPAICGADSVSCSIGRAAPISTSSSSHPIANPSGQSPEEFNKLIRDGYKISADQAASLEQELKGAPDNLNARAMLMGYYFAPGSPPLGAEARIQSRRAHILWLIRNRPESLLLMTSEATIDRKGHSLADADGYEQARKAWIDATANKDASVRVLANAGKFFFLPDKALSAQLFARARKLEPGFVMMQGSVMAFALAGITAMNNNGLPGPADSIEANSEFAKSVREELETTKDAALMFAVAGELASRGAMAQAMSRSRGETPPLDALALSETLYKKIEALHPNDPTISLQLARIYELRAMSATSEADKKSLVRARYEHLVKATSRLSTDDPSSYDQFLTLARASLDANELDRAEALAKNVLALVPRLRSDPRAKGMVGQTLHRVHLVLGGVALHRGDVVAAKAALLDAGRVEGDGSLSSFGPNMALAKELLERGEKEIVIEYLELCRRFWRYPGNKIDTWIAAIRRGEVPDFGANLVY